MDVISLDSLIHASDSVPGTAVVVDVSDVPGSTTTALAPNVATSPAVYIAITGSAGPPEPGAVAAGLDVAVTDADEAAEVVAAVDANPLAATSLALLLRGGDRRSIGDGLVAESATYSALQAGPEFARWLSSRPARRRCTEDGDPVKVHRVADRLVLTLSRPRVHNAFDTRTRDRLLEALAVAAADESIAVVEISGEGPSFCSGGDLDEFGTSSDPASSHVVRLATSVGAAIAAVAGRVAGRVHGTCIGAGVELPAFAGRVVAAPGTTFVLPEVAMGLIPGAGGTVSVSRRIGRQRTAWLALVGRPIDETTALAWGLVDAVQ